MPSNLKVWYLWCQCASVLHSSAVLEKNWSFRLQFLSFWALEWFDLSWWHMICSLTLGISRVCFVLPIWVIRTRCLVQVSIMPMDCLKKKLPSMISWFLKQPTLVFFKAGGEGLEAVCCHLPLITADRPSSKQPLVCCWPHMGCCHS